jgi:hypothetical protein
MKKREITLLIKKYEKKKNRIEIINILLMGGEKQKTETGKGEENTRQDSIEYE